MKKIFRLCEAVLLISVFAGLYVHRKDISAGVWEGMFYSINSLLPSLLPFMFLSSVFLRRPAYDLICRLLSPITRYIFRLPPVCGGAILSGLCFGYPVGAKLTAELLEKGRITAAEAGRMLCFCVSPGAAFCLLYLRELFGNVAVIFFAAVTLSCTVTGLLLSLGVKLPDKETLSSFEEPFSESLRYAVDSTAGACLSMVMYIVVFRAIFALCSSGRLPSLPFFTEDELSLILAFITEVTSGVELSAMLCPSAGIIAFGLGFGGLCIIFQLLSFFRKKPAGFGLVFISRLFQGLLSAVFAELLCRAFPFYSDSISVFSTNGQKIPGGIECEPLGFVFLVLLFGCYILSGNKKQAGKSRRKVI